MLSQSNGIAISAVESDLINLTKDMNEKTGINASAEADVVWSAYHDLMNMGWIDLNETVVLFATGIERC